MLTVGSTDFLDQGCLLKGIPHPAFGNLLVSIILNPTCFFHNSKVDSVVLAYLIPVDFFFGKNREWLDLLKGLDDKIKAGDEEASKKKSIKVRKLIGQYIDNDEPRRFYYLKGEERHNIPDTFVDFQQLVSLPFDQVKEQAEVFAKVNSPWREKLTTHYAGYMMRIGVERLEGEAREASISKIIKPIQLAPL